MSDGPGNTPINDGEKLARFSVNRGEAHTDGTVRDSLFLPPQDLHLSVNRHHGLSEEALWSYGRSVAKQRSKPLHGRADLLCKACREQGLQVVPDPLDGNPYHTHVIGWPADKPTRKMITIQLAKAAGKLIPPPCDETHTQVINTVL